MTTERNIVIYAGEAFTLSLPYAGTAGRGQRAHIRTADATATVVQILTHNGAANARVLFDGTDALDLTIGGSVSAAWVVGANRVEWVYDIEDYDLSDADDVVITHRGKVIVYGNRTRESDVTPSDQMPSGDGRYVRFDGVQALTVDQQNQVKDNLDITAGSGSGDVVGPSSATDDRIAAFDGVTGKLIKQGTVTATAVASHLGSTSNPHSVTAAQVGADPTGTAAAAVVAHTGATDPHGDRSFATSAVSTHAGAVDPHGDRAYADGLAGNYATAGHDHTGVYQPLATVLTNTTAAFTTAQETKLSGIEAAADVTDAGNVGTAIDGATAKTTPVDADTVPLIDSAAANSLKKLSWANIKATAKTYFDTLYQAILVSGTNIKTVNSTSLLGSGDIAISGLTGFTAAENTSSPNATIPVASLTANNAATNVDLALVPKGIGAVIADVPDGTATGGNKRGNNAVDLQTSRSAASAVAGASYSVVVGGNNNTASGIYSTAIGGSSNVASGVGSSACGFGNTASGAYSWAMGGVNATTRGVQASGAYAMVRRAADGDRQTMVLPIACAARTGATATVMTSDAGAASATNQMVLPNNSSMFFEVDVVAHDSTLKSASWKVQGTIRRGANAAATAIVGTNVTTAFGSDLSGGSPGVACTADTTNGALQVTFTGIAATTIYPSGHIRTVIAA